MVSEKSPATRMMERIMERYHAFKDAQAGEEEVPFMMEKVPRRSAGARIRAMTPTQRQALAERVGMGEAIHVRHKQGDLFWNPQTGLWEVYGYIGADQRRGGTHAPGWTLLADVSSELSEALLPYDQVQLDANGDIEQARRQDDGQWEDPFQVENRQRPAAARVEQQTTPLGPEPLSSLPGGRDPSQIGQGPQPARQVNVGPLGDELARRGESEFDRFPPGATEDDLPRLVLKNKHGDEEVTGWPDYRGMRDLWFVHNERQKLAPKDPAELRELDIGGQPYFQYGENQPVRIPAPSQERLSFETRSEALAYLGPDQSLDVVRSPETGRFILAPAEEQQTLTQVRDKAFIDGDVDRATDIHNFLNAPKPTTPEAQQRMAVERLRLAQELSRSPGDYLTFLAHLRGELPAPKFDPARPSQRLVPLSPLEQQEAASLGLADPLPERPTDRVEALSPSYAGQGSLDYRVLRNVPRPGYFGTGTVHDITGNLNPDFNQLVPGDPGLPAGTRATLSGIEPPPLALVPATYELGFQSARTRSQQPAQEREAYLDIVAATGIDVPTFLEQERRNTDPPSGGAAGGVGLRRRATLGPTRAYGR